MLAPISLLNRMLWDQIEGNRYGSGGAVGHGKHQSQELDSGSGRPSFSSVIVETAVDEKAYMLFPVPSV